MKQLLSILCSMFFIIGCGGDDNPANSGQPIANQTFSLPPNSTPVEFRFIVDTDVQQNVFLQGKFSVEGGSAQMAVMNETEYQTWTDGGIPEVLYSPGNSSGESFILPIDETDVYYVVFNNTGSNAVTVKSEIFLTSTSTEG